MFRLMREQCLYHFTISIILDLPLALVSLWRVRSHMWRKICASVHESVLKQCRRNFITTTKPLQRSPAQFLRKIIRRSGTSIWTAPAWAQFTYAPQASVWSEVIKNESFIFHVQTKTSLKSLTELRKKLAYRDMLSRMLARMRAIKNVCSGLNWVLPTPVYDTRVFTVNGTSPPGRGTGR